MEYSIFIDESGEREYGDKTSAYFVYNGIVIKKKDIAAIEEDVRKIKRAFFDDENVEFKSNWFRIPRERRKRYLEPYELTETELRIITKEIYRVILEAPITIIASVIDKKLMIAKYKERAFNPSSFAYELLMERFQFYLKSVDGYGKVVMDDISGKTPKGHHYKQLINKLHSQIYSFGTTIQKLKIDRVPKPPSFWPSTKSNLLQLTDFCAYNVFRQFRNYGKEWNDPRTKVLPLYAHLKLIIDKYHQGPGSQLRGYGIVRFPEEKGINWQIKK